MTWIQTHIGYPFEIMNPKQEYIEILDIAHALSHLCRFTGHVPSFYSVAQHSLMVSHFLPPKLKMIGLLHDATEAYVGDVSAPLKRCPGMEGYKIIEDRIWEAIAKKFDLPVEMPPEVKEADKRMLVTEKQFLFPQEAKPWEIGVEPYEMESLTTLSPAESFRVFMRKFIQLKAGM